MTVVGCMMGKRDKVSKIKWIEIYAEPESISTSTEKIEHVLSILVIFLIMWLALVQLTPLALLSEACLCGYFHPSLFR